MGEIREKADSAALTARREKQLKILSRVNQQINEHLEVNSIMRTLVEAALELTGAKDGTAGLFKEGQMVFTEYYTQGRWVAIDYSFPPGYGVPGWVIEHKNPYISNDAVCDPNVIPEIRKKLNFYNLADTPILDREGGLVGCFEIHNTEGKRPFDKEDIVLLQGLSASAAVAIENARMIEDLRSTENKLRESRTYLRSLFEESPVSLWEEDFSAVKNLLDDLRQQGVNDLGHYLMEHPEVVVRCATLARITDVNKATIELFEAKNKEDLISNLDKVFTEESFGSFRGELICLATGGEQDQATVTNRTLKGNDIEVSVEWSILPGYEDSWGKIVVSMTDVTREREIDRMKNEFIATAAHELRTPLSVLMGYAELLLIDEAEHFSPDEKREYLQYIFNKGQSLEQIIDDLLDVEKIESGRTLLIEKSQVQFSDLLVEICNNHQRATEKHFIHLDLPEYDVCLLADLGKLTQVMDNLLSNAVKYSPDGGDIRVSGHIESDRLFVRISDQGIGMNEQQCKRIFDKFYRADMSNTALRGLGLGMSIAKSIVEAHDGSIWVESIQQKGTTVSFTIPLVGPQP